ncbi:MAG: tetratricopeptide repeat protein [Candidatus Gastranaerophilaceae bacterium]
MKKAFLLVVILFVSVISTACINNLAVQELNNKAKTYLDQGDFENAISRLKSSIDLDSTIFETHYNLGIAYTQAEKYPEAVETFQNAIKLKPDFADTYYSLAVAQENYAKGIIDGTIKEKAKGDKETESVNSDEIKNDKKLSKDETVQVAKLLNDSIASYSAYLEKGKNIEDKQDVEEKIKYLQTQLLKYSDKPLTAE